MLFITNRTHNRNSANGRPGILLSVLFVIMLIQGILNKFFIIYGTRTLKMGNGKVTETIFRKQFAVFTT